jgi:hypothetical protein
MSACPGGTDMTKLWFAIAVLLFLLPVAVDASDVSVTVQVNWDDGSPFAGRFVLYAPDNSFYYTLDSTGWASVQDVYIDPAQKYELILYDYQDNVILEQYSIPVPAAEAAAVLSVISGKQITVTIDPSDSSIEDVHLEDQ